MFAAIHLGSDMLADCVFGGFTTREEAVVFARAQMLNDGCEEPVISEPQGNITWINWDKTITTPKAWLIMPLETV